MWPLLLPLCWAWTGLVANGDGALVVSERAGGGTRLTRVDEAGRPLGFVELPDELACAAFPWNGGATLLAVAPDGEGSRILLRTVDSEGQPAPPVELGRSPEHPAYTSEWACKVATFTDPSDRPPLHLRADAPQPLPGAPTDVAVPRPAWAQRPGGGWTAWFASSNGLQGRPAAVFEVREEWGEAQVVRHPWTASPRAATYTRAGSLLLFQLAESPEPRIWGFDHEGQPRTSRPVPLSGAWRADVSGDTDRAWVAFADGTSVRWGTSDGARLELSTASERPADDVAVAPGAVAWTDAWGAHVRTDGRLLDLPELGQLGLAATIGGFVLLAERRDVYAVEVLELDTSLGLQARRSLGPGRDPAVACDSDGCTAAWVDGARLVARDLRSNRTLPAPEGAWPRSPRVYRTPPSSPRGIPWERRSWALGPGLYDLASRAWIVWIDAPHVRPELHTLRAGVASYPSWEGADPISPTTVWLWGGEVGYSDREGACIVPFRPTLLEDGCVGGATSGRWFAGFTRGGQPFVHHMPLGATDPSPPPPGG